MFRTGLLRSLPSVGQLDFHKKVSRLIGGNSAVFAPIATYSQLINTSKSDAVVAAARLGRAEGYIARGALKAALEDVTAVIKNPSASAPELTPLAAAMRLRINNALLAEAEQVMIGSDGGNASEVSDLRGAINNDFEFLSCKRGGCQLTAIAKAEFMIAQGKYQEALTLLDGAIQRFSTPAPAAGSASPVAAAEDNAADIITYQKAHDVEPSKEAVQIIKSKHSLAKDEEAVALAAVFAAAGADHVFIDFFGPTGRYALWRSPAASSVRKSLGHFGGVADSIDNAINHYAPTRPSTTVDIEAALKSSKPVLSSLSTLPKSNDAALASIIGQLTESCKEYAATGPKTPEEFAKFHAELREQIVFRCKTNKAVCLTELKKEQDAVKVLDEVVKADKYLHMWKAFLARGRANKASGHIDAAENDLKKLFALKLTHQNHDVPLKDEYRTKSVF